MAEPVVLKKISIIKGAAVWTKKDGDNSKRKELAQGRVIVLSISKIQKKKGKGWVYWEAEADGSLCVRGQPGLHCESQAQPRTTK